LDDIVAVAAKLWTEVINGDEKDVGLLSRWTSTSLLLAIIAGEGSYSKA
jgi:hypothetical protein